MPTVRQAVVAALTRWYPFYSGCGTFANHPFVQGLAGPGSSLCWTRIRVGYLVPAPLNDYVGRALYFVGELDRKISWVCSRLVRPGDTVLDVGANLGLVTFLLSALTGGKGCVHAFEPVPRMQELITEAIARNRVSNVVLHRLALGAEPGFASLSIPQGHVGRASCVRHRQSLTDSVIRVPIDTLSAVLGREKVTGIRLVKLDVEGYEPEVLEGAFEHFSHHPPDCILFELNKLNCPLTHHPTLRILQELGYGFFSIPKCFIRMRVRPFEPRSYGGAAVGNDLVAARRDIYHEVGGLLCATA